MKRATFGAACQAYLEEKPRSPQTIDRLDRLRAIIGDDTPLSKIGQATITKLRSTVFSGRSEATVLRSGITPIRAVLEVAVGNRMLDHMPRIVRPDHIEGRTNFLRPYEAERLIAAMSNHLKPLGVFLFGTGARLSEALYLDWRDVNLTGGTCAFWAPTTKARKHRFVTLYPRVVVALANISQRTGPVFRTHEGRPYTNNGKRFGGQIRTAWNNAVRRAGLGDDVTPHVCRHTWASWYYQGVNRNLLDLQREGGWSSLAQVQVYAHGLLAGCETDIRTFLGLTELQADMKILHPQEPVASIRGLVR